MTLKDLNTLLKSTGYPVALYGFKSAPTMPYIVYIIPTEHAYGDDFSNLINDMDIIVELYSNSKDTVAEKKVETVLNFTEYYKRSVLIKGEAQENDLFQVAYEFNLVQKI